MKHALAMSMDANGKKVIQCNVRDITKRKYAERSEQQLGQAQKMEAVGQFAGGVAYDFTTFWRHPRILAKFWKRSCGVAEPPPEMIVEIHKAGTSAKDLTRQPSGVQPPASATASVSGLERNRASP